MKIVERVVSLKFREQMRNFGGDQYANTVRIFELDNRLRAIVSRQIFGTLADGRPDKRWHLSISVRGQERLPTWEELKLVRRAIMPNVFFCIPFPPEEHWMSYGEVLHLSETRDRNAIAQWIHEGERAKQESAAGLKQDATLDDLKKTKRRSAI